MKRWRIFSLISFLILMIAVALGSRCIANILAANGSVGLLRITSKVGANLNRACYGSYPIIEAVKSRRTATVNFLLANKVVCLAKIESAPFAEHIADVHRLNLGITEVQMPQSSSLQERAERVETVFGRTFP